MLRARLIHKNQPCHAQYNRNNNSMMYNETNPAENIEVGKVHEFRYRVCSFSEQLIMKNRCFEPNFYESAAMLRVSFMVTTLCWWMVDGG